MKGLILKDIYSLKKVLIGFFAVMFAVIVLGILFSLSVEFGNIEKAIAEGLMTKKEFFSLYKMGIYCILVLPMAMVPSISECFKVDKQASFYKLVFSFPLEPAKIVGARFAAMMIFVLVAFMGSTVACLCLSLAAEGIPFSELFPVVVLVAGFIMMYASYLLTATYQFGAHRIDMIMVIPLVLLFLAFSVPFMKFMMTDTTPEETSSIIGSVGDTLTNFVTNYWGWFLIVGFLVVGIGYVLSVKIVKKRRGLTI